MADTTLQKKPTRIQRARREEILAAALDVFSRYGFRGATVGQVAEAAGMSTPALLYYFEDKEALYAELLRRTMSLWLGPLDTLSEANDPIEEICAYVARKIEMSRAYPRESRLFAGEILQGIPTARDAVFDPLAEIFRAKIVLLERWIAAGRIAELDPYHLLYSIWATTQHYADFEAQIAGLSPQKLPTLHEDAAAFLIPFYRKLLTPEPDA
ncbi:MAG: TetR family transcriptional regulator C-terminal domain-containing protein [Pseudomonadota bacterium]